MDFLYRELGRDVGAPHTPVAQRREILRQTTPQNDVGGTLGDIHSRLLGLQNAKEPDPGTTYRRSPFSPPREKDRMRGHHGATGYN